MSARPWYKRYPSDFIAGTIALNFEEKGAYSIILDLLYDKGGEIDDDPQWTAHILGLSTRKWKLIRDSLIRKGKLFVENGKLSNKRAKKQSKIEEKNSENLSNNGEKGALKTNEKKRDLFDNNNLDEKGPNEKSRHTRSQKPEPEDTNVSSPLPPGVTQKQWEDFKQHRKQIGSPLTAIAESRAINKLQRFYEKGIDPGAVIEQTLENGWKGLFELKGNWDEKHKRNNGKSVSERADDAVEQAINDIRGGRKTYDDSGSGQAELRYLPYLREDAGTA